MNEPKQSAPLPPIVEDGAPAGSAIPSPNAVQATLPSLAAQLHALYAARDPLSAALNALDVEISRVETLAHQAMATLGVKAYATGDGELTIKAKPSYKPVDWQALYDHILATGEFDLIQRRLSTTALKERGAELPPGVIQNWFDELKFTPTKGKQ
jgi:hypothetical protein